MATKEVTISAPNFQFVEFKIKGIAPYVQNAFSKKIRDQMIDTQKAGSTARKGSKREPKDFELAYEQSKHISEEGWLGIPAGAFRKAMISACRIVGFKMTLAKLSVFVLEDGFDKNDDQPLVKITKGEPYQQNSMVRVAMDAPDIHARAHWKAGWEATVRVRYDADMFTAEDIANLMMRVGLQVGIGEGRPDSKKSAGMGWGLFEIVNK